MRAVIKAATLVAILRLTASLPVSHHIQDTSNDTIVFKPAKSHALVDIEEGLSQAADNKGTVTPTPNPIRSPSCSLITTPDPSKLLPNIGKLLTGYDIMMGNPLPTRGMPVDPGYRLPIFAACYANDKLGTPDGRHIVPDGTVVAACNACTLDFSSTEIGGSKSYQNSLNNKVSVSGGGWGAKFSASADFKRVATGSSSNDMVYTQSMAQCCVYKAQLLTYKKPSLSTNFVRGIASLPSEYNGQYLEDNPKYLKFIQSFGTHYVTEVTMGCLYGKETSFTRSAWSKMRGNSIDIKAAASAAASGFAVGAGFEHGEKRENAESFNKASSNSHTYTMGSRPEKDPLTWAQKCGDNPAPFRVHLSPIQDLLDDHATPQVKANLGKALGEYCTHLQATGEVQTCQAPDYDQDLPRPIVLTPGPWSWSPTDPACNGGDCDGLLEGDGDCDYDSDCVGHLKCGNNNCPYWDRRFNFHDDDDCCYWPDSCAGKSNTWGSDCNAWIEEDVRLCEAGNYQANCARKCCEIQGRYVQVK